MTSEPSNLARVPRLGLALGGGGARGLAHIGILKVFDRAGIAVEAIAGTSMGGIIGAFYLAGVSPAQMEEEFLRRGNFLEIVKLLDLDPSGSPNLLRGRRIYRLLYQFLGERQTFADLSKPFAVVAVDLNTGREVVLREGVVADAVRATMSVPGVFAPHKIEDCTLVDGGVLNNVPVDVARELGAEVVVAVDVLPNFRLNHPKQPPVVPPLQPRQMPRLYHNLWHVQLIMIAALTEQHLAKFLPEVIIRPELPIDMDLFIGFDRPKEAIEAGERAAEAALPKIMSLLENSDFTNE